MFITNKYIITKNQKQELYLDINGIKIKNFLLDEEKYGITKEKYKEKLKNLLKNESILFFDELNLPQNFVYIDNDVIIENNKIKKHDILLPSKKLKYFNDFTPLNNLLKKYKNKVIISIEKLNNKTLLINDYLDLLKLRNVFIKICDNWEPLEFYINKPIKFLNKIEIKTEKKEIKFNFRKSKKVRIGILKFNNENLTIEIGNKIETLY